VTVLSDGIGRYPAMLCALLLASGCGKKGPPLPPLVKFPTAPGNLTAERRGATVDLQFTVPTANTDNTRPANVARVEIYAFTGSAPLTDAEIMKHGKKIVSLPVKAPRDPNRTVEEDEADADVDPPEGAGTEQGSVAHAAEALNADVLAPFDASVLPRDRRKAIVVEPAAGGPLLGPPPSPMSRTYVGVGLTTRGKPGAFSKRVTVPLVPPPLPPEAPMAKYDERAITVTWKAQRPGGAGLDAIDELPSTPIGAARPAIGYNVYDTKSPQPTRLTASPIAESQFTDKRIAWGEERCYAVRAAETVGGATLESEAPPPACVTLTDTFPPKAPANLKSAPSEGAITLIWDANTEGDLAGYLIFRGAGSEDLRQLTPAPIQESTFRDEVERGMQFVYAVKAVDKAGNISPFSDRVREIAR